MFNIDGGGDLARIIQEIERVLRKKIGTNELISSYPEHHDLDGDLHSPEVRRTVPGHAKPITEPLSSSLLRVLRALRGSF